MKKIPCVVLIYFDFEVIRTAINALLPYRDRLDLIIVENKSEFTETRIKPYIQDLLRSGQVSAYVLFSKNISNNIFGCLLDAGHIDFGDSDYVMFTDGDLVPLSEGWLAEEVNILDNNPDVFVCTVTLSASNLPRNVYPEGWTPGGIEHETYFEEGSGLNFLLMRTAELRAFVAYRKKNGLRFLDFEVARYCREILKKKWVRTKHSEARHLTWDSYQDLEHPYTKLKLKKSYEQTWAHNSYCSYEIFRKDSVSRHVPLQKIAWGYAQDAKRWVRTLFQGPTTKYKDWDWKDKVGK